MLSIYNITNKTPNNEKKDVKPKSYIKIYRFKLKNARPRKKIVSTRLKLFLYYYILFDAFKLEYTQRKYNQKIFS